MEKKYKAKTRAEKGATTNIKAAAITAIVLKNGRSKPREKMNTATIEQYLKWAANGDFWNLSLIYELTPPENLRNRGEEYINAHIDNVREMLLKQGVSGDTTEAVLIDYCNIITGDFSITANLTQMNEALQHVSPVTAFVVDKYILYEILFSIYARYRRTATNYIDWVVDKDATRETKLKFLDTSDFSAMEARAFVWLVAEFLNPALLMDIAEPWQISACIDDCTARGNLAEYAYYYIIAKYCLSATTEELKAIPEPPTNWKEGYTTQGFAEAVAEQSEQTIKQFAAKLTEVATTDTAPHNEEKEQEIQEAKTAVKEWEGTEPPQGTNAPNSVDRVRIPKTFGLLLSRSMCGSPDENPNNMLPIQTIIREYMEEKKLTGEISPNTVEKTVEGLNLLQRTKRVTPVNGIYTFTTNISEFSGICGFKDANEKEKKDILTALRILDGLYLIVWTVKGASAVNVLNMREIGISGEKTGTLVLDVTAKAMQSKPQLLAWEDFQEMRKKAKGLAQRHFMYQIQEKGHKREDTLLNEIFGYETKIAEAQRFGTPEEIQKVKKDIQHNKSNQRKRLLQWFEEYQNAGYIQYTRKANAKGEIIYSWDKIKTIQIPQLEQGETMEPDEQ